MKYHYPLIFTFIACWLLFAGSAIAQTGEPHKSYDYLCDLFAENYPTFEEKGIKWQIHCDSIRQKLRGDMTDQEVFAVCSDLLRPLNDAHVSLKAESLDLRFSASRPSRVLEALADIDRKKLGPKFRELIFETLEKQGFSPIKTFGPKFRDKPLFYYTDNGKVGYLAYFRSFSKYIRMVGGGLESQLDEIFQSFEGLDAVIVDVRFNIGGEDFFSHAVASRFIEKEMLGYYKQTRKNGSFGPLVERRVKASESPFTNPVIVLTNDRTVSAADVFLLIMDELPQVTIVGDRSNGSYSDIWSKKLPNGWKLNMSNQRYLTVDKRNHEGLGNPVDIEVHNTLADFEEMNDSVLLRALEALGN